MECCIELLKLRIFMQQIISLVLAKIILDIEFVEIVSELDNGTCARSHLGNSSFGSHSPRFSSSDNDIVRISKSSIGANFQCLNVGIILTRWPFVLWMALLEANVSVKFLLRVRWSYIGPSFIFEKPVLWRAYYHHTLKHL